MSWLPNAKPSSTAPRSCDAVETVIVPRARDLGGFEVRRALPSPGRRTVGPFVFFDEIGPTTLAAGTGIDVRPHPHIGLATITYLFKGTIIHRDSLGSVQPITPGDINWMTAGRGIVHSERSDAEIRKQPEDLHGLQLWIALPAEHEETDPAFTHYPGADLPTVEGDGVSARVMAGTLFGATSPVATLSPLFYADVTLAAGARLALDPDYPERAAYIVGGAVTIDGASFEPGRLPIFAEGRQAVLEARTETRFVLLGGAPLEGPRHIWWNFVSTRPERIEKAKADWRKTRFGLAVPGDDAFIPLPEEI